MEALQSSLYTCRVSHRRLHPKEHSFEYPVFYLYLDLAELDRCDSGLCWFSRNRFNLFSFHDDDHFGGEHGNIEARLHRYLETQNVNVDEVASIRMMAFPRVLGYVFNPVTFFFCFDAEGQPLCAVTQVTNTFKEQKLYFLGKADSGSRFRLRTPKHFYVSPFSDLELCFDFRLRVPEESLSIHINDVRGQQVELLSHLSGERHQLSDGQLLRCAVKYPLLTLQVITLIHWHAFRLWLKRLPWHRKASHPESQTHVLRPHASLRSSAP